MEKIIYEIKPYAIVLLGGIDVIHPVPWWGIVSGTILVTLGVLIIYMRKQYRE